MHELLEHTNSTAHINTILDNRKSTMGGVITGTCIVNDSDPPILHSVMSKKSDSRSKHLFNLKGSQNTTMVYGKIFEDAACRPKEYSIWCKQCTTHHPVHNQDACLILFVTEDQELAHGCKSHLGSQRDTSFQDRLEKGGIPHSKVIHIEFINVHDGGAYADNRTWLSNLIARECNC